jgi:formamidopyrimidine-DNA glycosylase
VRRGLERALNGARLEHIEIFYPPVFRGNKDQLLGQRLLDVGRRGKMMMLKFEGDWFVLAHLRMTGQMIFVQSDGQRTGGGHPNEALVGTLPCKHTRAILNFGERGCLYFNDQRKFGYLKLVAAGDLAQDSFLRTLGPEPWEPKFNAEYLAQICQRRKNTAIKAILLDQKVVAGVGNIYADEALFRVGIAPWRKAGQIDNQLCAQLVSACRQVLELGIEFGGVSVSNYVNAEGLRGQMQEQLQVYRRTALPCKQCETPIAKNTTAGRGTHFCPKCQT